MADNKQKKNLWDIEEDAADKLKESFKEKQED